jgi:polyisoprenoid-binding protein YceI
MTAYEVDRSRSELGFTVRHMVIAKVRGRFGAWTAALDYDSKDPARSSVSVEVDTASVDTRETLRDAYLRSPEFFDSTRIPKMVFRSTSARLSGRGRYALVGDLTIRGVTRQVTLEVEAAGGARGPSSGRNIGFEVRGAIHRSDWGLVWNAALETGGMVVSDKVDIEAAIEFTEKKQ